MYLHVGNHRNIREKRIIGIFDTDTSTVSPVTKKFLSQLEKSGRLTSAGNEIPKSFILYEDKKDRKTGLVCFSQFSANSLAKRLEKYKKNGVVALEDE